MNRDYNYEFGVTLGQSFNLAIESLDIHQASDEDILNRVGRIFQLILNARIDKRFVRTFEDYWQAKENKQQISEVAVKII